MRIRFFILMSGLAAALFSCQSKDDLMQDPIEDGNTVLSVGDRDILPTGDVFSVAFTANSSWSLKNENDADWLEYKPKSGKAGTTVIKMSADCNWDGKERHANLVFHAKDGSFSTDMKVTQGYPYLKVDVDSLSFDWSDCLPDAIVADVMGCQPKKIRISSNVPWKIEEVADTKANKVNIGQFEISSLEGENDFDLDVIPLHGNFDEEPYEVKLKLYPVMKTVEGKEISVPKEHAGSYIHLLRLRQKNLRFLIDEQAGDALLEFSELKDTMKVRIDADSKIQWEVNDCPAWVMMDCNAGSGLMEVSFNVNDNPDSTLRVDSIMLSTGVPGVDRKIKVRQKPYIFEIDSAVDSILIGNDGDEYDVPYKLKLKTTGSWKIDYPDWLEVEPSEQKATTPVTGKDEYEIVVKAKGQNLDLADDHIGNIKIRSTLNELSGSVAVKQDRFVFELGGDYDKLNSLLTKDTNKYEVEIRSSGEFEIRDIEDWIAIEDSDVPLVQRFMWGPETVVKKIGAKSINPDLDRDRTAVLKVVSLSHEAASMEVVKEIPMCQSKFIFKVQGENHLDMPAYKSKPEESMFGLKIRCSDEWTLQYPDWLTLNGEAEGDGTKQAEVFFTPETNEGRTVRNGKIVVKSEYNDKYETFDVSQEAFVFDTTSVTHRISEINAKKFEESFELTAEAGWTLDCKGCEWLMPSSMSGSGSGSITFAPEMNADTVARKGTALIHSTVSNEDKKITFFQKRYRFNTREKSFRYSELDKKTDTINVVSSGAWEVKDVPDWMIIEPSSGDSSRTITVKPKNNVGLGDRRASFSIVSKINYKLAKNVRVEQDAYKFDTTSVVYSYSTLEERSDTLSVLSSGAWAVSEIPAWISIDKSSGKGNESGVLEDVVVTSRKNLKEEDLEATLKFVSRDNQSLFKQVHIHQDKFDFRIDATECIFDSPLAEENDTLSVNVICPANWTVKKDKEWIDVSLTKGTGNSSFRVNPTINATKSERSGKVIITSDLNGLAREIVVHQEPYRFDETPVTLTFASCNFKEQQVPIECSGEWEISVKGDSWVTATPSVTKGNGKVTLLAAEYSGEESRETVVKISSKDNPALEKIITVIQRAHILDLSESSLLFDPFESSRTFGIVSTGPWYIDEGSVPDGFIINPKYDAGGDVTDTVKVSITASVNVAGGPRGGKIRVCCRNTGLVKELSVSQPKYEFEMAETPISVASCPVGDISPITVTSSGRWSVAVSPESSWLTVSPASGNGSGTISLTVADNGNESSREANVIVTCVDYPQWTKTVKVTQSGHVLNLDKSALEFDAFESVRTFGIETTGPWVVDNVPSGFTVNPMNGDGSYSGITVTASVNIGKARGGRIRVKCANTELYKEVSVSQPKYEFDVDRTSVSVASCPVGDISPITVTSSGRWSVVSSDPSWLTVSPASGNGSGTISLTVTDNGNESSRVANVIVTCEDYPQWTEEIRVVQAGHILVLTPDQLMFNAFESSHTFGIETTGPWVIDNVPSGFTVSPMRGDGSYSGITVTASVNTGDARGGRIRVKCANTELYKELSVSQPKYEFDVDRTSVSVASCPVGDISPITVTSSGRWSVVSSKPSWLTVSPASGNGSGTISLTVADNGNESSREANVIVTCVDYPQWTKTVKVTQSGHVLNLDKSALEFDAFESVRTFGIETTGPWVIDNVPSGFTVNPMNGDGSYSGITVTASVNTGDARGGRIRVKCANTELYKEVSVSQPKYEFEMAETPISVASCPVGDISPITVTSSGRWSVAVSPESSWLTVSPASGNGSGTISLTVADNGNESSREANVIVTCVDYPQWTKTVKVTQSGHVLNLDKSALEFDAFESVRTFGIETTGPWVIDNVPSGFTVNPMNGDGSYSGITVTASVNIGNARGGRIRVKCANTELYKEVSVSQPKYEFDVDRTSVSVASCPVGDISPISVTSSGRWSVVSSDPSWLTVSPASGNGSGTISLTVTDNGNESSRVANVIVTCEDYPQWTKTVKVTQSGHVLDLGKNLISFGPLNGKDTFSVTTTGPWRVESDKSWCTVGKSSDGDSVIVQAETNATHDDRTAVITVSCTSTSRKESVTVTQSGYEFDSTPVDLAFESCPSSDKSVKVTSSGGWTYKVVPDSPWLTVEADTNDKSGTLTLTASSNPSSTSRNATVTVTNQDNTSWTKIITVTQAGHVLNLGKNLISFGPLKGKDTFSVTTTGPWTVESDKSWCTVGKSSDGGSVIVQAETNATHDDRTAVITVSCTSTSRKETVTVTQSGYEFDSTPVNLTFESCPSSDQSVKVTSSGGWTYKVVPDSPWLTVEADTNDKSGTLTLTASSNPSSTSRNATVVVTNNDNPNWKKEINVSQKAFEFTVSESSRNLSAMDNEPFKIIVTCSTTWDAISDSSWLTCQCSGNNLILTPSVNEGEERTAVVTITNSLNSKQLSYKVYQAAGTEMQ